MSSHNKVMWPVLLQVLLRMDRLETSSSIINEKQGGVCVRVWILTLSLAQELSSELSSILFWKTYSISLSGANFEPTSQAFERTLVLICSEIAACNLFLVKAAMFAAPRQVLP